MAKAVVKTVLPESAAMDMGLEAGDAILEINNEHIGDILDYRFLCADEFLSVKVEKKNGDIELIEVGKDAYEDLGIEFENGLIDAPRRCANNCVFCFIDQNPKGMRESIYFKDDDARMSFFQGNYITLTNLSERDIDRIIKMRVSPINVSVHTTDGELRKKMLGNLRAGKCFEIMSRLAQNGIRMNAQIVLCPGLNDGEQLEKTISDLFSLSPHVSSLAVVPVGLTGHREGLCNLLPVGEKEAAKTLDIINKWQKKCLDAAGTRFVFASDEFYLKADRAVPRSEEYEGFPQLENGVGMLASMKSEFDDALCAAPDTVPARKSAIITGVAASNLMKELAEAVNLRYNNVNVTVHTVINNFFGGGVTVAGLLCGCDIIAQLKGKLDCDEVLISSSMLRADSDVLLDDMTVGELESELGVKITPCDCDGYELLNAILGGSYV